MGGGCWPTPPPPNPPEASRSRQALTGQEQRARQNEPPHRLHGDVGRGRKRNRPQALPSPPQPPAPPPSPLRRPRPSPSALSSRGAGGRGGSRSGTGQLERTTPNRQPMGSLEGRGLQLWPPIGPFHVRFPADGAWPAPIGRAEGRLANRFRGGV